MEIMSANVAKLHLNRNEKTVMITGVSGQDGSHMADLLLNTTTHNIIGGARRLAVDNHENIKHLEGNPRFHLVNFDLSDTHAIDNIMQELKPDYFINLAAQTFVKASWDFPMQTWTVNTTGVLHILEAIRQYVPSCRFYNAGSSEEFGDIVYSPQDEKHPMRPRSPYAASKVGARQIVKVYRESYNLFAIQSWLFNHEGVRRGKDFVTRKISSRIAQIYKNIKDGTPVTPLDLGALDAKRDWGDAEDYVRAIWLMLNNDKPEEYVVATGESHGIREFVEAAFEHLSINGSWIGEGTGEIFWYDSGPRPLPSSECELIVINPANYRPAEVAYLQGDNRKIKAELGWEPKTTFKQLVEKMVDNDLKLLGI